MHIHNLAEITFDEFVERGQMLVAFENTDGHVAWIGFQPTTNNLELIEPDRKKVPLQGVSIHHMMAMRGQIAAWVKSQGYDANGGSSSGDNLLENYAHEGVTDKGSIQLYTMPKFSYLVRNDHRIKNTAITVISHDAVTLEEPERVSGVERVIAAKGDLEVDPYLREESGEYQYEWLHNGCEHGTIGIGYQEGEELTDSCKGNMLLLGKDCAIDLTDHPAFILATEKFVCTIVGTKLMTMCESRQRNYIVQNTIESEFTKCVDLILGGGTVKKHEMDFEHFKGLFTDLDDGVGFIESADQALISLARAHLNYGGNDE